MSRFVSPTRNRFVNSDRKFVSCLFVCLFFHEKQLSVLTEKKNFFLFDFHKKVAVSLLTEHFCLVFWFHRETHCPVLFSDFLLIPIVSVLTEYTCFVFWPPKKPAVSKLIEKPCIVCWFPQEIHFVTTGGKSSSCFLISTTNTLCHYWRKSPFCVLIYTRNRCVNTDRNFLPRFFF